MPNAKWSSRNLDLTWPRRVFQGVFFCLWYYTFFHAYVNADNIIKRNPVPDLFLRIDPLSGIISSAAVRAFAQEATWWVPLIVLTLLAGRFFCGWICPLGTCLDVFDHARKRWTGSLVRNREETYRFFLAWKYYLLAFIAAASLVSINLAGYLDPLCVMVRTFGFGVQPLLGRAEVSIAGKNILLGYGMTTQHFFNFALFSIVMFTVILAADTFARRWWCRSLCPLGALLGVLARFSFVRLAVNHALCGTCQQCGLQCKTGAINLPVQSGHPFVYRKEECITCYLCVHACKKNAIALRPGLRFWDRHAKAMHTTGHTA